MVTVTHTKVSAIADDATASAAGEILPSDWNDDHVISGLTKTDVGLANVDNTSDANKPVSTAQQAALDLKQNLDSDLTSIAAIAPSNDDVIQRKAGAWTNRSMSQIKTDLVLVKGDVGLGNVDNTSDANKPVSTATQTALNLKADLASPTFTGTPAAPTAVAATSTTQLATTAFVTTADNLKANIASPTLTGVPAAPTAAPGTNTTQLATTAFVAAAAAAVTVADGDKGDITVSGTGTVYTIDNSTVTNAKMANMAAGTVKANTTGGAAAPVDTTISTTFKTALSLAKGDVGLGNVDNTSDANKPVSTATQTALNLKADLASPTFTGTPAAPTAVAATSTTQLATTAFVTTADNLKANIASPTFTGVPAAPTAAAATNTTQLATTAFVTTADNLKANLTGNTFTGVQNISESLTLSGTISPAQINADQNNYAPANFATSSLVRISSDADGRQITGVAGGTAGRVVFLQNIGSFYIVLVDESASSTAANRFKTSMFGWGRLERNDICMLVYDGTASRWQVYIQPNRAVQSDQEAGTSTSSVVISAMQQFHPSSCKAWGQTTGGGTPVMTTSYNMTSITDTAVGRLTITIGTDFSSANWAGMTNGIHTTTTRVRPTGIMTKAAGTAIIESVSAIGTPGTLADPEVGWDWALFGDQ
jgi:hypothetical protein